jgi:hypothetical protein
MEHVAVGHNKTVHEKPGRLDFVTLLVRLHKCCPKEALDVYQFRMRKISKTQKRSKMNVSPYEPIKQILSKFAKKHHKILDIKKCGRLGLVIDQNGIRENNGVEGVMPMDIQSMIL